MSQTPAEILIDADRIQRRVHELADRINNDYADRELTIVGVMSGVVVFLADLIRGLELPVRIELVKAKSYREQQTTPGELVIDAGTLPNLTDQHLLLIDDIFDTGQTMHGLIEVLSAMQPASLKTAVLLWKRDRNETELTPDYVGFEIPDRFVVGYGLDFDGLFRNLPEIRVMSE